MGECKTLGPGTCGPAPQRWAESSPLCDDSDILGSRFSSVTAGLSTRLLSRGCAPQGWSHFLGWGRPVRCGLLGSVPGLHQQRTLVTPLVLSHPVLLIDSVSWRSRSLAGNLHLVTSRLLLVSRRGGRATPPHLCEKHPAPRQPCAGCSPPARWELSWARACPGPACRLESSGASRATWLLSEDRHPSSAVRCHPSRGYLTLINKWQVVSAAVKTLEGAIVLLN